MEVTPQRFVQDIGSNCGVGSHESRFTSRG